MAPAQQRSEARERQVAAEPHISTGGPLGNFSHVTALTRPIYVNPNDTTSLYRARMDNKDVILRALKENASNSEKQHFLGFASFLGGLGPHPFIPALLGVVSVQPPLVIVMEELRHRDLLGFLWRCREVEYHSYLSNKLIYVV